MLVLRKLSVISTVGAIATLAACGGPTMPTSAATGAAPRSVLANPIIAELRATGGIETAAIDRPHMKSWSTPNAARQSIYVVDPGQAGYYGGVCYYGPLGGAQLGCLDGGASSASGIDFPQGSWIDVQKHLFVANGASSGGYSGQVTEYDLPLSASSTPINTLYSSVSNPSEGAMLGYVCGDREGNIYGTTIYSTTIAVWKAGTMNGTQTSTLTDSKLKNVGSPSLADGPVACATNAAGDLFISGQFALGTSGNWRYYAELDEFHGGASGPGRPKVLQRETSDLYFPAGVALDQSGNVAWALFNLNDSGSDVCTYSKPYTGSPTSCTSGFATGFHFTKDATDLWGGDTTVYPWYAQPGPQKTANEIAYPGGGLVQSTSGSGLYLPVDASVYPTSRKRHAIKREHFGEQRGRI
ncbi:MAG: hypothetical protein JO104_06255 [Candidatus Eremiobacteraeota bacterium]|nr:hypothetical protein [Candidatus Eremiobacteraeota bacterium]